MIPMNTPVSRVPAAAVALALSAAGCSAAGPTGGSAARAEGRVEVVAAFYPLQFVAERVGGQRVWVSSLTPPAVEPHDLELSPQEVARIGEADLALYLSGFQPAVDEAVAQAGPPVAVDVSDTGVAQHFWLDPTLLAGVAATVAEEFATIDPDGAAAYRAAAEELADDLAALDADFSQALASCESRTIVVSHEAFGYLSDRYDLKQMGIAGLSPEAEASPARLAEIGETVRAEGVTTIFTEPLVSPKVAETLASDLGITTRVLDPLEGLVDEESDYEQVMRANLAALETALRCE
ncbi:metal ABC transporter substrate-binding protein [Georgenia daeguensis]|uniref:metal ABC transporter substrate-binding protein n=1 Tax=Georgenia daeguensis TaxID=908355 RepID=UPI0031EC3EF7